MNKILKVACLGAVLGLMTASCSSDDDKTSHRILSYDVSDCFAYMTDVNTNSGSAIENVGYSMEVDFTANAGSVKIVNFRLPSGDPLPMITVSGLKLQTNADGTNVLSAERPALSITGWNSMPNFTDFSVTFRERMIDGAYWPVMVFQYTVNNAYKVFSTKPAQVLVGTTVGTIGGADPYETTNSSVAIVMDYSTMTLMLQLPAAQFAQAMPAINLTIKGVPFAMSSNGTVSFDAAGPLTPFMGENPNPGFPVTNLKGSFNYLNGTDFGFDVSAMGQSYHASVKAEL